MRVDRSVIKGFSEAISSTETTIQRKNGKVTLAAGKEDEVLITQVQDSLKIQVNSSSVIALNRDESKNVEILPGEGRVSVDPNVTIPIKGHVVKQDDVTPERIDPSVSMASKEETSVTANLTQKMLASVLPGDQSDPDVPSATPESKPLETSVLETKPIDIQAVASEITLTQPKADVAEGVSQPQEISTFLRSFIGNSSISLGDQQTIQTLLANVEARDEFNQIVDDAGGKKVGELFTNDQMKQSWNRLVGAYARLDLAENRQEAKKTRDLFAGDANNFEQFLSAPDQPLILRGNVLEHEIDLSPLDRRTTVCLVLENAVRTQEGRPLINPNQLREKTVDHLLDSSIPKEERLVLLENLRTESGLSEYQMREIVSRPLTGFFESAVENLMALRDSKTEGFQTQIQEAVNRFGPESVAVEIGRAERDEFFQIVEPEMAQFEALKATASEIFSGPADPLVKVDRLLQKFEKDFLPPVQIPPLLKTIEKGAVLLQENKLQSTLPTVKIPELKNFAQQGIEFLAKLPKAGAMMEQMQSAGIPGFESFGFLHRVVDGTFRNQIQDFRKSLQAFEAASPFGKVQQQIRDWRSRYEDSTTPKDRPAITDTGRILMQDFANGSFSKPVEEFVRNVNDLRLNEVCSEVIESVRTGSDLLLAFRNGRFVQILAAVSQRAGNNPAILQIIQQALHLITTGTNFFRVLMNRDWEKPVGQALKKDPRSKELREVHTILSDSLNFFAPLQNIDYLTPFLQYQKQLETIRDEDLRSQMIQRYEDEASKLLNSK